MDLHAINILQPFNGWMELRHFLAILISCACGLAIGYERTSRNKQAGVKTHMIVALTSCLMMIISKEAFLDTPDYDTSRVAAQIVSGISFIGGGIIFMRDKKISGLTTAAGIWATSGIGMAIGGGFWFFGAVCSAVIVIVQKLAYEPLLQRKSRQVNIYCEIPNPTIVQSIYNYCHFGDYQSIQVEARELDDEKYELVMGERRWRATQAAGLETIPAIIRDTQDIDLLRDALLENLHRSQLNPIEEAAAYQQLMEEFSTTQEQLAKRIGRSRPQISNTIRLLRLPPLVQRRVAAGVIAAGHARALLTLTDQAKIETIAQKIVNEGLSVRAVEELVAHASEAPAEKERKTPQPQKHHERLDYIADAFADKLDTSVKISLGARKGKMTIEFANVEDLNRIIRVLDSDFKGS